MSELFGFEVNINTKEDPPWWTLSLPHQCDEWDIGWGTRAHVLAEAKRFRAELDGVIAQMEEE